MPAFEYEGPVYVRSLSRGVCLGADMDTDLTEALALWLQELTGHDYIGWSGDWHGRLRIRAQVVDGGAGAAG